MLAGEASGDILGAEFLSAWRAKFPTSSITYTGGPAMQAVLDGQSPVVGMDRMAFMGFAEVLRHLPVIWTNDRRIKAHLRAERPDLIVLVDYPGYNLRLAKWLDEQGFRRGRHARCPAGMPPVLGMESGAFGLASSPSRCGVSAPAV